MVWAAVAIGGSAVIGAVGSAYAANKAGAAANKQNKILKNQFRQQVELAAPYREAGLQAIDELKNLATSEFNFGESPGYKWRLSQGLEALKRAGAAHRPGVGGLRGGTYGKRLIEYSQNLAAQEYDQAFNRYLAQLGTQIGIQSSIAGMGQGATGSLMNAGTNIAANRANAVGYGGEAQAAGIMGVTGALQQGLGQYMQWQSYQNNSGTPAGPGRTAPKPVTYDLSSGYDSSQFGGTIMPPGYSPEP